MSKAESTEGSERTLIIHFDVNETILIGDQAAHCSFSDCVNNVIAKNAYVRNQVEGDDNRYWVDGTPIKTGTNPPPLRPEFEWPPGCQPYYRAFRDGGRTFTEEGNDGEGRRGVFDGICKALEWPTANVTEADARLCVGGGGGVVGSGGDGGNRHYLLPAFFRTICELEKRKRKYCIVIRTFGKDISGVVDAINAFAEGCHLPQYPAVKDITITKNNMWTSKYSADGSYSWSSADGRALHTEDEILQVIQSNKCVACKDDYSYWKNNGYTPESGKPVWVTWDDDRYHHIFFDDNIHNLADDSIVAVRARARLGQPFKPVPGKETLSLHGIHIVRVPTYMPIFDEDWFMKQIELCERAREKMVVVRRGGQIQFINSSDVVVNGEVKGVRSILKEKKLEQLKKKPRTQLVDIIAIARKHNDLQQRHELASIPSFN